MPAATTQIPTYRSMTICWAAVIALVLAVPRGAPVFLALLLALTVAIWVMQGRAALDLRGLLRLLALPLALSVYAMASAAWSPVPMSGLGKAVLLAVFVVAVGLMSAVLLRQNDAIARALNAAIVCGVALGAAFVLVEILTEQGIERWFYNTFKILRPPGGGHLTIASGTVMQISDFAPNRNVGALNLLLWPALLAIACAGAWMRMRAFWWGVIAVALVATMLSVHASSKVALLASAGIFVIASYARGAGRALVVAGWIVCVVAVLPAAFAAYDAGLYKVSWLPYSARARIVLWHQTAVQYFKAPVFGAGANSVIAIHDDNAPVIRVGPEVMPDDVGRHSHNIFLQVWFELGVVGAALLLAAGLMLTAAIRRMPDLAQPYGCAAMTAVLTIGSFSWGLWQEWYQALITLAAIILVFVSQRLAPKPA